MLGVTVRESAEHLGEVVPFVDFLILFVGLEKGVLQELIALRKVQRIAVGVRRLSGHFLGGVGVPLE